MGLGPGLVERFAAAADVIREPEQLRTYECDGLTGRRVVPALVALPGSAAEVQAVVRICNEEGLPFVARGAGTGLSGGALPVVEGIVISLARLTRILEVDVERGQVVVEPGVANIDVTRAVAAEGFYYAPDPSSQQVCTIGGNVAENSGGAHCLKYGFTSNHVLVAEVVLPDGELVELGGVVADTPGYDLTGALVGSEGTLGIVTEVVLRILRKPEATRTFFATFPSNTEAANAVSAIIASGIVPAAIEMMDTLAIAAAKAATGVDWPEVGAALLMDVDGVAPECEHTSGVAVELAKKAGALEIRVPRDAAERELMWKGRKSAFAAVGRIARNYLVQDGVIPRSAIARVLQEIAQLGQHYGLRVANVFHAGDGNLHPLVLFDGRDPAEEKKAEEMSGEILRICLRHGGSLTGEHGIGTDKAPYMPEMFTPQDLETMQLVRCAFDPGGRFNPGKVFPSPRLCGDKPGLYRPHPTELTGEAWRA